MLGESRNDDFCSVFGLFQHCNAVGGVDVVFSIRTRSLLLFSPRPPPQSTIHNPTRINRGFVTAAREK